MQLNPPTHLQCPSSQITITYHIGYLFWPPSSYSGQLGHPNHTIIRETRSALGKLRLYNSLSRHTSLSSLSTPLVPSPHSPSSAPLQSFPVPPPNEHYFTYHVHPDDHHRPPLRCRASPCQLSELRRPLRQQPRKPREQRSCAEAIPHHLHVQLP